MSSKHISILLTGATGYIGGSILTVLLHHPDGASFRITVLLRVDGTRLKKFQSNGVIPLLGSNDSHEIIEKATSQSDGHPSSRSIISGFNQRTARTGKAVIYIHTGGTGVLAENLRGRKGTGTVYNDLHRDQINALPETQSHRKLTCSSPTQRKPKLY